MRRSRPASTVAWRRFWRAREKRFAQDATSATSASKARTKVPPAMGKTGIFAFIVSLHSVRGQIRPMPAPEPPGTPTRFLWLPWDIAPQGLIRACLQLGGLCTRTDQNQTRNIVLLCSAAGTLGIHKSVAQ